MNFILILEFNNTHTHTHTHTHTYERRIVSEDTCIHHESEDTSYLKILTHRNMFSSNPYNFEEYSCMSFF